MEFRVISDTHHEFGHKDHLWSLPRMRRDEERVLVIAGDFCQMTYGDMVADLMESYSKRFRAVVYVPGNHEYYAWRIKPETMYRVFNKKMNPKGLDNIHFLIRDSVVIDDVRFVGATLWTDVNRGCPVTEMILHGKMNDFKLITYHNEKFDTYRKFRVADWKREHAKDLSYIKETVESSAERCVVVTHHAPTAWSLDPRFANDYYGNFGYHSVLDDFILDHPQITNWCHGHIHHPSHYKIGDTQIICNPYGYPDEDIDLLEGVFYDA